MDNITKYLTGMKSKCEARSNGGCHGEMLTVALRVLVMTMLTVVVVMMLEVIFITVRTMSNDTNNNNNKDDE
jgi:hypothetical protein